MTQRTRTRESSDDLSDVLGDAEDAETASDGSEGFRSRAKRRAAGFFSPRYFLLATLVATAAMFLGGMIGPGGSVAGLLSVFAASFLLGAVTSDSRILETATGGAVAAGLVFLLNSLVLIAVGGLHVAAIGAGAGFLAAGLGAYLGGDLREGLTRDL